MMNEITLWIIIGLGIQLFGALIIVNPVYFWKKRKEFQKMLKKYLEDMQERRKKPQAEIYSQIEELGKRIKDEQEKFIISQFMEVLQPNRIILGIGFLVIGFILQIIAELYR